MKQSVSITLLIIFTFGLIGVVSWYYLFSKITANTKVSEGTHSNNDSLRTHSVNDLATKLSLISHQSSVQEWPNELQQIGTADEGCSLVTPHCSISKKECFDLKAVTQGKYTIPVDSAKGTEERTGFAIRKSGNSLEIFSCYTDRAEVIAQELRL